MIRFSHKRHRLPGFGWTLLLPLMFLAAPPSQAQQEIEVPAWFKRSFLDLRDDVKEAGAAQKRVMVYFGQNGCPYCKRLMEINFRQQDIVARMQRHFEAIEINILGSRSVTWIDGRSRTEKEFAALFKVQFTPTLLFLDEKGGVALRVDGYYPPERFKTALDYVSQRNESKLSFTDFQKSLTSAGGGTLRSAPSFRGPPYMLDRRKPAARPLAVFFEQAGCPDCDEMHATALKSQDTLKLLSRFDVYHLDMRANDAVVTPAGARTTARNWVRELKLQYAPGIVFFDNAGREIFRIDAYVRTFHLQSALDYVASRAYQREPSFQTYLQARADAIRARGGRVDLTE